MNDQEYTSAKTSINSKKVPALARALGKRCYEMGIKNFKVLDYGGGKYNTATEYLKSTGLTNVIYDPFNRTPEENSTALAQYDYDIALLSNVLNVIKESDVRINIIKECYDHIKPGGMLLIKIYEGNRSGVPSIRKDNYQCNKRTEDYIHEVFKVFRKAKVITWCGLKIIWADK